MRIGRRDRLFLGADFIGRRTPGERESGVDGDEWRGNLVGFDAGAVKKNAEGGGEALGAYKTQKKLLTESSNGEAVLPRIEGRAWVTRGIESAFHILFFIALSAANGRHNISGACDGDLLRIHLCRGSDASGRVPDADQRRQSNPAPPIYSRGHAARDSLEFCAREVRRRATGLRR